MTPNQDALVEYARRSHENAERTANAALRMEQAFGRMEREIGEQRRSIDKLNREMRAGFEALNSAIMVPQRRELHSITEEDFQFSDTGTHAKVTRETVRKILRQDEVNADAKKWRALWRKVRSFVFLAIGGAATMAGEQLLKHLLHL